MRSMPIHEERDWLCGMPEPHRKGGRGDGKLVHRGRRVIEQQKAQILGNWEPGLILGEGSYKHRNERIKMSLVVLDWNWGIGGKAWSLIHVSRQIGEVSGEIVPCSSESGFLNQIKLLLARKRGGID